MTRTRFAFTVISLVAITAVAASVVIYGGVLWRNRDHLGRSWNCRRFTTEAPPNLRALHQAELAFREAHGHFTTDLVALGFEPKPGEVRSIFYVYGFGTPYAGPIAAGEDPSRSAQAKLKATGSAWDLPEESTATENRFLAAAVASELPGVGRDIWTIDERGRLRHVENGCWE